ncbi:MAG: SpoIIE family protein phosphatase [Kineosporiaceae bacterium]
MTWLGRGRSPVAGRASGPALFLAVLAGHLLLAVTATHLFDGYRGYPIPWPANGVVLAALVLSPRRRWGWALAAGGLSESLASAWFGLAIGWAQAYAAVNLLQVLLAAALFRHWAPDRDLGTRRGLVAFVAAALVLGAGLGGAAGTAVSMVAQGAEWWPTVGFYWAGDAIGLLVAGAMLVAWGRASSLPPSARRGRTARAEWAAVLVLVTVLAASSLVVGTRPVGYLALGGMMWAALRLGVRGALTSALVVTCVQGSLVADGRGVFADQADSLPAALAYFTAFLFVAGLAAWVLAVEVGHGRAAERREATHREARLAAQARVVRLVRLREFADAVFRAATTDDVIAAWHTHAPGVLAGRDHTLVLTGQAGSPGVGAGSPEARAEARAVAERRVVAEVRAASDPAAGPGADAALETVVAAPLLAGDRVLGVLSSVHDGDVAGDPVRREEAAAAAARLAEVLVRIRLSAETVDSARRLGVLQDLTSRLGRAPTTEAVVALVLDGARRQLGARDAGLLLPDGSGALRPHARSGIPAPDLALAIRTGDDAARGGAVSAWAPRYGPSAEGGAPATGPPGWPTAERSSWAVLPLVVNRRVRGLAWYAWEAGRGPVPEDRALHAAFADQCAAALRRVTATDVEHDAAVKLQQALLPRSFPAVEGIAAAARYVPSSEALSVGGDWYDVVARPDGRGVIIVGDVVGHDVTAAAAMGQLRSALATVAVEARDPAVAIDQIRAFPGGPAIGFATALYADFDAATGVLRYACAGHPPPLLVKPWGEAEFLTAGRSGPLFAVGPGRQLAGEVTVPPGSLLVCYSDGLVERRDRRFHDGLVALARACLAHRHRPLPEFTDDVLAAQTAGRVLADDVALLCAHLSPRPRPRALSGPRSGRPSAAAAGSPAPRPTRA